MQMTSVQRQRKLAGAGTVTVRVREPVQPADVVAEVQAPAKHYFLDLAAGLGIPAAEASRHLRVELGGRVEADQVLAGPVGIARRTMRAPASGRVLALTRGRLLFEARQDPVPVHAGLPGEIAASDGSSTVTIETVGALVQGVWGNGRRGWGVMRIVGEDPAERLRPDALDIIMRGALLVAGACDNPAPLHQATELSVRGIVLGSMSAELIPVALRMAYPIILTEGFGTIPMNGPAYELLSANAGREASLEATVREPYAAELPEVIIPLPASQQVRSPEPVIEIMPGMRVRALRPPHTGAVGNLLHLLPRPEAYPSGVLAKSAMVELEGIGSVAIPLANLEVLP
jgi:hypothetical protein